jgi:hypothetical protein
MDNKTTQSKNVKQPNGSCPYKSQSTKPKPTEEKKKEKSSTDLTGIVYQPTKEDVN